MILSGIVVAGTGACVGLLGGWVGRRVFAHLTKSSRPDQPLKAQGSWKRSLTIGLLASGAIVLIFGLGGERQVDRLIGLACLPASFISAVLYVVGWLKLVTTFGPGVVEAGELSVVVTMILTALLYVCGFLWITLVVLGGCVLLAMTVLNGLWIYRLR